MTYTVTNQNTGKIIKKIELKNSIQVLDMRDVVYIESEGRYLHIQTRQDRITIRSKLKDFIEDLEDIFLHSHQSYAVNMSYIKRFEGKEIELSTGKIVPVSRSKCKVAKEKLINYLEKNYG